MSHDDTARPTLISIVIWWLISGLTVLAAAIDPSTWSPSVELSRAPDWLVALIGVGLSGGALLILIGMRRVGTQLGWELERLGLLVAGMAWAPWAWISVTTLPWSKWDYSVPALMALTAVMRWRSLLTARRALAVRAEEARQWMGRQP